MRWISSVQKSTLLNIKEVNSTHFRHFRKLSLYSRLREGVCLTHELHPSICSHSASVCAESPATRKVTWTPTASALAQHMRRLVANSITCCGKRPIPKYFSGDLLGDSLKEPHLSRSYSLFSDLGGGERFSPFSFPIFVPKDATLPSWTSNSSMISQGPS